MLEMEERMNENKYDGMGNYEGKKNRLLLRKKS